MLGKNINDPSHVETGGMSKGLGLLDVETELLASKKTVQVRARTLAESWAHDCLVEGYEIHMGRTTRAKTISACFRILTNQGQSSSDLGEDRDDGAMSAEGLVWGTYIHGVFDQPDFRRQWLHRVRVRKNLLPLDVEMSQTVSARLSHALDRWADHVEQYCDIKNIFSVLEA